MGQVKVTKKTRPLQAKAITNIKDIIPYAEGITETLKADFFSITEGRGEEIENKTTKIFGILDDTISELKSNVADREKWGDYLPEEEKIYYDRQILSLLKILYEAFTILGKVEVAERPDKSGQNIRIYYKGEVIFEGGTVYDGKKKGTSILSALEEMDKRSKSSLIKVSKDLMETGFTSGEDALLSDDEETKTRIAQLQKEGKLLSGTTSGLRGGTPYLKVFILGLAQIVGEQSKYWNTEEDLSGIPEDKAPEIMGGDITFPSLSEKTSLALFNGLRKRPVVFLHFKRLAEKMSKTGKIAGGKDVQNIIDYIDTLSDKEYIVRTKTGSYKGVRLLSIIQTEYNENLRPIGYYVSLSPQFSKSVREYSGVRSDTIQLLGGGNQTDITMDLFYRLAYARGIQGGVLRISKKELIKKYLGEKSYLQIKNGKTYVRTSRLEADLKEAINRCMKAKIITRWESEKNPGNEEVYSFYFNPNYLSGDKCEEGEAITQK